MNHRPGALIDISPLVSARTAVFPGDTPFERRTLMHVDDGHHISLSAISTTVHLGAHADAPVHYGKGGRTLEEQPLDLYVGPCRVVRVEGARGRAVAVADLAGKVPFGTERLVVATGSFPDHERWNSKDLRAHAAFLRHDVAIIEGVVLECVPEGLYELIALPLRIEGADASPVRAVLRKM